MSSSFADLYFADFTTCSLANLGISREELPVKEPVKQDFEFVAP